LDVSENLCVAALSARRLMAGVMRFADSRHKFSPVVFTHVLQESLEGEDTMKSLLLLVAFAVALACSPVVVAQSQNDQSQALQGHRKVKVKDGKIIVRDKSKPVRKAIEDWYALNVEAFKAKDVAAIMALRTDHFHTLTPDGKVNTRADMEAYTQRFLGRIDHFISLDFEIGTIEVQGSLASADVTQKTIRMQRFPDGTLHKVEAGVVQREMWKQTADGWKMYRVENIRDGYVLVDDEPYTPTP
jgi:ketosteroid isomerase-like protein